jgi:hypothetical protein
MFIIVPLAERVVTFSNRLPMSATSTLFRSEVRLITLQEATTVSAATLGNATSSFCSFGAQPTKRSVTQISAFHIPNTRSRLPAEVHRVRLTASGP